MTISIIKDAISIFSTRAVTENLGKVEILKIDIFKNQTSERVLPAKKENPVETTLNLSSINVGSVNLLPVSGSVTGGTIEGQLLAGVDPKERVVGFKIIRNPANAARTWVIVHGWNSTPENAAIAGLTAAIANNAGANDRILALDWSQAAGNGSLVDVGNGKAATWVSAVAEFAAIALQQQFGIDTNVALNSLNLVGHSLGSLVSAEIGRIYRDGFQGQTTIVGNREGVKTISALDPPSELNLSISGGQYDLDGRKAGVQRPEGFSKVSQFSRAFNGALSIGGNANFAVTADEAFQMDFGNVVDNVVNIEASEHIRVVKAFSNIVNQPNLFGNLLGLKSDRSINDFNILENLKVGESGYRAIVSVNHLDVSTLLIARAKTGINDDIVIGSQENDVLAGKENSGLRSIVGNGDSRYSGAGNDKLIGAGGNDRLFGKADNDTLIGGAGNDELYGDLVKDLQALPGRDILYGGTGIDLLTGGENSDTFVFKPGDGGYGMVADTIADFQLGVDRIGLIDMTFEQLAFQQVNLADSLISFGSESLALVANVSANALQNREFFVAISESMFQVI